MLRSLLLSLIVTSLGISCGDNDEIVNDLSNNQEYKVNNNGHGYVDLGLSVLWATCNVGANAPSDQGNKYAFGETQVKSSYTSSNYTGGEADVAKELWGGDWRLPTKSELEDIVTRCSWADNTRNNIHVVTATGPNGSSIDLPYYSYLGDEGYQGWYWSEFVFLIFFRPFHFLFYDYFCIKKLQEIPVRNHSGSVRVFLVCFSLSCRCRISPIYLYLYPERRQTIVRMVLNVGLIS